MEKQSYDKVHGCYEAFYGRWRDFTLIITPLDGSAGVKYGRKNVL